MPSMSNSTQKLNRETQKSIKPSKSLSRFAIPETVSKSSTEINWVVNHGAQKTNVDNLKKMNERNNQEREAEGTYTELEDMKDAGYESQDISQPSAEQLATTNEIRRRKKRGHDIYSNSLTKTQQGFIVKNLKYGNKKKNALPNIIKPF